MNNEVLTQEQMFEKTFERPTDFFLLDEEKFQKGIDRRLGILDWNGEMTPEQRVRYNNHYNPLPAPRAIVSDPFVTLWSTELQSYGAIIVDKIMPVAYPVMFPVGSTLDAFKWLNPVSKVDNWSFISVTVQHD
jgi:hypothetical protein